MVISAVHILVGENNVLLADVFGTWVVISYAQRMDSDEMGCIDPS